MGQTRVVERPHLLGDPGGPGPEIRDEGLGDLPLGRSAGQPHHAAGETVQVEAGAGEGQRRVQRERPGADGAGGLEHGQPVPPGGVGDQLPGVEGAAVGQHAHHVGQHVVGHREQQQVAVAGDRARALRLEPRQQVGDPRTGRVGLTGDRDDAVTAGVQAGGEDGADATRADHPHPQAPAGEVRHGPAFRFQSRRPPLVGAGPGTRRRARGVTTTVRRPALLHTRPGV